MNLSYRLLLILLLPIYILHAMEEENKKGPKVSEVLELPSGILRAGQFFDNEAIAQRQSVEMVQDPTGSHRGRSLTVDNPNPAALTRTPTSTTDGSTPTTSMPVSVAASKAQLPELPSASRVATPSASATQLPGLNADFNVSGSNLLASVIPPTVFKGPGDTECNTIIREEVIPMIDKSDFLWSSPTLVKKRAPKITQSSDDKSSGGEKSGEEKTSPKKSRSGTVLKELPGDKKEFFKELTFKLAKVFFLKFDMTLHYLLHSREGLGSIHTYLGIQMSEHQNVPTNSLASVMRPLIKNELEENNDKIQKNNFKRDCCVYTLLGVNMAMSTATFAVALANYYS